MQKTDLEKYKEILTNSKLVYTTDHLLNGHKLLINPYLIPRPRCKRPNADCLQEQYIEITYAFNLKEELEHIEMKIKHVE
jgi:hypothetical protein